MDGGEEHVNMGEPIFLWAWSPHGGAHFLEMASATSTALRES